jgi:hypothetical protein
MLGIVIIGIIIIISPFVIYLAKDKEKTDKICADIQCNTLVGIEDGKMVRSIIQNILNYLRKNDFCDFQKYYFHSKLDDADEKFGRKPSKHYDALIEIKMELFGAHSYFHRCTAHLNKNLDNVIITFDDIEKVFCDQYCKLYEMKIETE